MEQRKSIYGTTSDARSSRIASSGRSHSPGREEYQEAERTVKFLKRELATLRGGSKGLLEIRGKLATLEHRYELLVQEKQASLEQARLKDN